MNKEGSPYIIGMLIIGWFVMLFLITGLIKHKMQSVRKEEIIKDSLISQNKMQSVRKEEIIKDSLISQNKMQEIYGWKKVVLWSESKDDFEKAYHTKLTWVNYPMEFVKHPDCIDPFGGSSEWRDDKICFYYRFPSGKPEIPNLIAKVSRGKTLVIIGSLYDNGKRFSGGVYWY